MADPKIPLADLPYGLPGAFDRVAGVDTATGDAKQFPIPQAGEPKDYLTRASLPSASGLPDGTAAYVNNDPNPDNNGRWAVFGGQWVQSADRVTGLEGRIAGLESVANAMRRTTNGYGYNSRGELVWTPLAVMMNGEDGPWYDLTDGSTLFADTSGTTPATVGGKVALILDKSGNGHHLTQANTANQATLLRDVQGNTFVRFPAGQATYYNSATGGQWPQFSVFAAIRPSQISASRSIVEMRSSSQVGARLDTMNTARLSIANGTSTVTANGEFPRPLLEIGKFSVRGGIYNGANAVTYEDDFRSAPASGTLAPSVTAGFRVGALKYQSAPTTSWEGDIYSLFVVSRAMTTMEARQAVASMGRIYQSGPMVSALSYTRGVVEAAAADANILVIGDSTGDAKDEWVYRCAIRLAQKYPRHTVNYRLFNFASNSYGAPETIQTGDIGRAINVWNCSISLSIPDQVMGDRFAAAVAGVPSPDLVVWNHGHNISNVFTPAMIRGQYIGPMEKVRQQWPNARHAAMLQNPRRDDATQEVKFDALRWIKALRPEITLIDARAGFEAAGKNAGLYIDNIHPGPEGSKITADVFMAEWNAASLATHPAGEPWLNTNGTNLLTNGRFTAFSGAVPDGWTVATGNPIPTKDTGVADAGDAYSFKIANGSGVAASYSQSLTEPQIDTLKGQTVSLAARVYGVESSSRSARAAVIVTTPSGATTHWTESNGGGEVYGAFRWAVIAGIPVPDDATSIEVRLYGSENNTSGHSGNYGRVVLVQGDIPRNMA